MISREEIGVVIVKIALKALVFSAVVLSGLVQTASPVRADVPPSSIGAVQLLPPAPHGYDLVEWVVYQTYGGYQVTAQWWTPDISGSSATNPWRIGTVYNGTVATPVPDGLSVSYNLLGLVGNYYATPTTHTINYRYRLYNIKKSGSDPDAVEDIFTPTMTYYKL